MFIQSQDRKVSTTNYPIQFLLVSSTDHTTPVTGASPAATISKNGGSFISISGSIVEIGNGIYSISGNATDRNTIGQNIIKVSASGADNAYLIVNINNYNPFNIVSDVWDEILTGSTHNIPTSSGRRLRQLASNIVYSGTIVSATANTATLDSGADSHDGAYDPGILLIVTGNGTGQSRGIYQYGGASKICAVDRNWKIIPSAGDEFVILASPGDAHVNEGFAQGGTINTITLNADASSYSDTYIGQVIFIRSGTGEDQACRVISYNGSTKVATVAKNWNVIPDTTSVYAMLPTSVLDTNMFIQNMWNYETRTLTSGSAPNVSDIWQYSNRTLTSGSYASAEEVWAYPSRTLTIPSQSVQDISDADIAVFRGDTLDLSLSGLGNISDYESMYFTVKYFYKKDSDSESTLQVVKRLSGTNEGLLYVNGVPSSGSSLGIISIIDSANGDVNIFIDASVMAQVSIKDYQYDYELIRIDGTVSTLTTGVMSVVGDVTRAVA